MKKLSKETKKRLFVFGYAGLMLLLIGVIVNYYFANSLPTKASLEIGRIYQSEQSPYPAQVKVTNLKTYDPMTIDGDLIIPLPEGSYDIRITRQYDNGGYKCGFFIDFTTLDGTRQTMTWTLCTSLNGYTVVPHEIYAK